METVEIRENPQMYFRVMKQSQDFTPAKVRIFV